MELRFVNFFEGVRSLVSYVPEEDPYFKQYPGALHELKNIKPRLQARGWKYKDMPRGVRMSIQDFTKMLEILGPANHTVLEYQACPKHGCRGQFMISPEGLHRLTSKTYN